MDFRKPTRLGARLEKLKPAMSGYDHNYVLPEGKGLKLAARLHDPASGRVMEVRTTQPAVQLYTGNHLGHRAVCLETQHFPDSVHHANFPSTVIRPGPGYGESAVFGFSWK
jgi:aldose 1-epimerase